MVVVEILAGAALAASGYVAVGAPPWPRGDDGDDDAERRETARLISSTRKTLLDANNLAAAAQRGSPAATPPRRTTSEASLGELEARFREGFREGFVSPTGVSQLGDDGADEMRRLRKYGLEDSPKLPAAWRVPAVPDDPDDAGLPDNAALVFASFAR